MFIILFSYISYFQKSPIFLRNFSMRYDRHDTDLRDGKPWLGGAWLVSNPILRILRLGNITENN